MSRTLYIAATLALLSFAGLVHAQDDQVSLGDLARAVRKSKPAEEQKPDDSKVIDNDNFSVMMDRAESARLNGKPVFSIAPSGKAFRMTSLDGTCSLSFDARAAALIAAPYIATDLPRDELLKLEGPAAIHDDVVEVSVHNGTAWELKEIVVGITVLQQQPAGVEIHPVRLVTSEVENPPQKLPDLTVLYHLKGSSAPNSTSIFRGSLGGNVGETKDWHWAIVAARGIPPASPGQPPATPSANGDIAPQPVPSAYVGSASTASPSLPASTPNR